MSKYNLEGPLSVKNQLKWPWPPDHPRPQVNERSDNSPDSLKVSGVPTTQPQGQPSLETVETVPSSPGSIEIFNTLRVSMKDPCYKVLPGALRKYNINAPWHHYALYCVYRDKERRLGLEEKPLKLFKQLDKEGMKPMFMLREIADTKNFLSHGPNLLSYDPPGGQFGLAPGPILQRPYIPEYYIRKLDGVI
jgi:hypothetical protein